MNMFTLFKEFKNKEYKNAQEYFNNSISLPLYPNLSNYEHNYIIKQITKYLKKNA